MSLNLGKEADFGFSFKHSKEAGQGITQIKRIETASVVVATDESGDFQSIQEAIDSLNGKGGFIQVKEGDYTTNTSIKITANIKLQGTGYNTRLIRTTDGHIIENKDALQANNINIKDFRMRGTNVGSNAGVYLENSDFSLISNIQSEQLYYNIYLKACDKVIIQDCISLDANLGHGIQIENSTNCTITKNSLRADNSGINLINGDYNIITNNVCRNAGDIGITLNSTSAYNIVSNNSCYYSDNIGIVCYGDYNTVTSNNCGQSASVGIWFPSGGNYNTCISNIGTTQNNGTGNDIAHNINI